MTYDEVVTALREWSGRPVTFRSNYRGDGWICVGVLSEEPEEVAELQKLDEAAAFSVLGQPLPP